MYYLAQLFMIVQKVVRVVAIYVSGVDFGFVVGTQLFCGQDILHKNKATRSTPCKRKIIYYPLSSDIGGPANWAGHFEWAGRQRGGFVVHLPLHLIRPQDGRACSPQSGKSGSLVWSAAP